jgi:adenylylsulfate kinase-like enzyme
MEVSEDSSNSLPNCLPDTLEVPVKIEAEQGGQELFETVVTLSGLPKKMISMELTQILENSGQSSELLTLDQLRSALVAHLEALQSQLGIDES